MNTELQRQVAELQMSPTMGKLCRFAKSMPIGPGDVKPLLTTATIDLVRALDAGRIRFDSDEDAAMLHGLLLAALQAVFDGKLADGIKTVRTQ